MYCIECGASIPDNSKFCSNCGFKQAIEESPIKDNVEIELKKDITSLEKQSKKASFDYFFLRKALGIYLIWVLAHIFIILVFSSGAFNEYNNNEGIADFWPIGIGAPFSKASSYDITEFIVYTTFPLVIIITIILLKNKKKVK